MYFQHFDDLSDDVKFIRETVFMQEQGFQNEFDEIDSKAKHIVLYDDNHPIATCRIYKEKDKTFVLGRLAVLKAYRGTGLGSIILKEAENLVMKLGGTTLSLHAQCRVKEFYYKLGYSEFGEMDYDEDCPHIWMKKLLVNQ